MPDYGSGTLSPWAGKDHGATGDFAAADVGLVGDSITNLCRGELAVALSALDKTLAVDYWSGRPAEPAVTALLARPALPRILLFANFTNDVFQPYNGTPLVGAATSQIERLKDGVGDLGVEHLLVTDIQVCRPGFETYDQRNTGLINGQIHDAFDLDHICEWNWWLTGRGTGYLSTYLDSGGVHPTEAGKKFWRAVQMLKIQPLLEA